MKKYIVLALCIGAMLDIHAQWRIGNGPIIWGPPPGCYPQRVIIYTSPCEEYMETYYEEKVELVKVKKYNKKTKEWYWKKELITTLTPKQRIVRVCYD